MKQFLKQQFELGKEIIFDNERTFADDFRKMECTFTNKIRNTWSNVYQISFNGASFSFKSFDAFYRKFTQLKNDWNLELKKW